MSRQKGEQVAGRINKVKNRTVHNDRMVKQRLQKAAVQQGNKGPGAAAAWAVQPGQTVKKTRRNRNPRYGKKQKQSAKNRRQT